MPLMPALSRATGLTFAALVLAGILAIGFAAPAAAEGNCPAGYFPIFSSDGSGQQVGCAPIPGYGGGDGGGGYSAPPVQMRWVDNYFAAAWHKDSNQAWIAAGYQSQSRAEAAALAACNAVMGGTCTIAISDRNGTVSIARGVVGALYASDDAKKDGADRRVLEYCRKQNDECLVIDRISVTPGKVQLGQSLRENTEVYAPRGNPRRLYGAIAWIEPPDLGKAELDGAIWFVGGRASYDKASADAVALCQGDVPAGCKTALVGSDVFVAIAERDGKAINAASGASVELASQRAMTECKKAKGKCRIATTIDLSRNEAYRFDAFAQGQPYFSAQAWVKGNVAPWQNSVWSVSGVKDEESAKRAALAACKKESRQECEPAGHSFNARVALYIDQSGYIRLSILERDVDPAGAVTKKCAEAKVTCKLVKVVDTRVPLTERIEVK